MKKQYLIILVAVCSVLLATAQNSEGTSRQPGVSVNPQQKSKTERIIPPSDATDPVLAKLYAPGGPFSAFKPEEEILTKRGKNTKHFKIGDDQFSAVVSSGITHYWENGAWRTSSNDIAKLSDPVYPYGNVNNPAKVYYGNIGTGMKLSCPENIEFKGFAPSSIIAYDYNRRPIAPLYDHNAFSSPVLNSKHATLLEYPEVYPGTGYHVEQRCNNFKTQYVLERNIFQNLPPNTGYVAFAEKMELPAGSTVEYRYENGQSNGILVRNNGKIIFTYKNAAYWCDTAAHLFKSRPGRAKVDYTVTGNTLEMRIMVPAEWLQDNDTYYPVTIDPIADLYSADFNYYGNSNSSTYGVPNVYNSAYASTGSSNTDGNQWGDAIMAAGWIDDPYSNDGNIWQTIVEFVFGILDFLFNVFSDYFNNNSFFNDETYIDCYAKFPLPNMSHPSSWGSYQQVPQLFDDSIPVLACLNSIQLNLYQQDFIQGDGNEGMHFEIDAVNWDPQAIVGAGNASSLQGLISNHSHNSTSNIHIGYYDGYCNMSGGLCPNNGFTCYNRANGWRNFSITSTQLADFIKYQAGQNPPGGNFITFAIDVICRAKDLGDNDTQVFPWNGYDFGNQGPHLRIDYTYTPGSETTNATNAGNLTCPFAYNNTVNNSPINCVTNTMSGTSYGFGTADDWFYTFTVPAGSNADVSITTANTITDELSTNLFLFSSSDLTNPMCLIRTSGPNGTKTATNYSAISFTDNTVPYTYNSVTHYQAAMTVTLAPGTYYVMVETSNGYSPASVRTDISVNAPVLGTITHTPPGSSPSATNVINLPSDSTIDFCDLNGAGTLTLSGYTGNIVWKRATYSSFPTFSNTWQTGGATSPSISQTAFPPNDGDVNDYAYLRVEVTTGASCPTRGQSFIVKNRYNPEAVSLQMVPAGGISCANGMALITVFPGGNQPNLNGRVEYLGPEYGGIVSWLDNPLPNPPLNENIPEVSMLGNADGTYDNNVYYYPNVPVGPDNTYVARYNPIWDLTDVQLSTHTSTIVGCRTLPDTTNTVTFEIVPAPTSPNTGYFLPAPASTICVDQYISMKGAASGGNAGFDCNTIEYAWSTDGVTWNCCLSALPSFPYNLVQPNIAGANYSGPFFVGARRVCGSNYYPVLNSYGCTAPLEFDTIGYWNVVPNPTNPTTWSSLPALSNVCVGHPLSVTAATGGTQGTASCQVLYRYSTNGGTTWQPSASGSATVPTLGTAALGTTIVQTRRGNCQNGCTEPTWTDMATWTVVEDPGAFTTLSSTPSPNQATVCEGTAITITTDPTGGNPGIGCSIEYGYSLSGSATSPEVLTGSTYPLFAAVYNGGGDNKIYARRVNCQTACDAPTPWSVVAEWTVSAGVTEDFGVAQDPLTPTACEGTPLSIYNFFENTPYNCNYDLRYSDDNGSTWTTIGTGLDFATVTSIMPYQISASPTAGTYIVQARRTYCDILACTFQAQPYETIASWVVSPVPATGPTITNPEDAGTIDCTIYSDVKDLGYPGYNSTCYGIDYGGGLGTEDVYYKFTLAADAFVDISLCNTSIPDPANQFPFTYIEILDATGTPTGYYDDGAFNAASPCYGTGLAHASAYLPAGDYYAVVQSQLFDVTLNGGVGDFVYNWDITTTISFPVPNPVNYVTGKDTVCYGAPTEAYSVQAFGGNYSWTVPSGANVVSGQNTDAVIIDFGTATSGSVICTETYGAGCTIDYVLPITNVVAQTPVVTADPTCHYDAGKEITATLGGDGEIWYNLSADPTQIVPGTQYTTPVSINSATPTTFDYRFRAFGQDEQGTICESPVAQIDVVVNPLPADVTITPSGTPAVSGWCGDVTLNATGGAGGTIYWLNNVSTSLPPVATASSSEVVSTSGDYYFRSINTTTGCLGNVEQATVVVNTIPTAPALSNVAPYCAPTSVVASEIINGDTLYYLGTNSGAIGVISDGSEPINAPGTYYFVSQNLVTGCRSALAVANYPAGAQPPKPTVTATPANATACDGATVTLSASGTGGTIRWLSTDPDGYPGASSTSQSVDVAGDYYFRTQSVDGCWSDTAKTTVVINSLPVTPTLTVSNTPRCNDNTTLASTAGSGETAWFQGTTSGGTATTIASPAPITTPGTATYYFRTRNNSTGCWSNETSQSVTVYERPGIPVISGDGTVCDSATLVAASTPTGIMYYYGTNQGNTPQQLSTVVTREEGTHFFRAENNGCYSNYNSAPDGNVDTLKLPASPVISAGSAANGFGYYCGNVVLFATDSASRPDNGVIYWQGAVPTGISTANQIFQRNLTASGTYYFRAKDPNSNCWSHPTPTTVQVDPPITLTVSLDGCIMTAATNDKENVIVAAVGGTAPHAVSESGNSLSVYKSLSTTTKIYQIPIPTSGIAQTYYFSTTDAVGCTKTAANFTPPITYLDDIPKSTGTPASIDSSVQNCFSKQMNDWMYFRNPSEPNTVFAAINDNGQDLGVVTVKAYHESAQTTTIGNIHTPATCASEPMTALRRHFVVFAENAPTADVGVRLFFSQQEVDDLVAAVAVPTTGCDSTDFISAKEDLHVIKYHAPNGQEATENRVWGDNDVAGIYKLFGPNAATPRALNANGAFTALFQGPQLGGPAYRHYADVQTNDLSEFWLGGSNDEGSPLPVEMIYLEAEPVNNAYIRVKWATASEINNDFFNVERSTDAQTWTQIGQVDGQGDANGNSTVQLNYTFNDMNVLPNVRYYYRLKQVDRDAQFEYTGIVSAIITGDILFTVKDFMPNPAVDKASLGVIASADQQITVDIYNVIGEKVQAKTTHLHKGANLIDFDVSLLASGTYTAIVSSANEIYTRKLVVTR